MSHFSWNNNCNFDFKILENIQVSMKSKNDLYKNVVERFDNNLIPVIDIKMISKYPKEIYDLFFKERGAIIFKNVYDKKLMDEYNKWCVDMLKSAKNDANFIHPKQKNKYLINDLIKRMVDNNPDLMLKLLFDDKLLSIMDIILGFGTYGSATCHWINPKGKRQTSHVDYPIHVGSGKFWENSVAKLKRLNTRHQINNILPHFSFQLLIASDKMNHLNGSTEVVPCSHLIDDMDVIIHNKEIYKGFEKYFMNVSLEQGDMLIFNRRLCHRGGENLSNKRRNSLIIQSIYLWGIGQEIIDSSYIINKLQNNQLYNSFSEEKKKELLLRLKKPYPVDVKKNA